MPSAGGMLRRAVDALIVHGRGVDMALPEGTTWGDVLRRYGSSEAVADELGYPRGSRGSAAWKARRNFMRNFQAGRAGRRVSAELRERLRRGIAPGPRTRREVLNEIDGRGGVIVVGFTGTVIVSKDRRQRTVPDQFVAAEELHDAGYFPPAYANDWPAAAEAFAVAWGRSYGIGAVVWEDVDDLELELP